MAWCRSCGADIRWAELEVSSKRIPLDPFPAENGNILLNSNGKAEVLHKHDMESATPPLYVSHFLTCPNAGEHRRG